MPSVELVLPLLAFIGLVLGGYWVVSLLRHRDVETATESTASTAMATVTGGVAVGVIVAGEIVAGLQTILMMLLPDPGMVSTALLSMAGYLNVSDIIALTPETWGILVILAVVVGHVVRGRGRR